MEFKIVTESTVNLSNDIIKENDIRIVSLSFIQDGVNYNSYENGDFIKLDNFYDKLNKRTIAKTSCANENDYFTVMQKVLEEGYDILYLGLSVNISSSYNCCMNAIEKLRPMYPNNKIVSVDTRSASFGQGMMLLESLKLQKQGVDIQTIATEMEQLKNHVLHFVTANDLYCLYKGGRIPKILYRFGALIKLNPIITVTDEGVLASYANVISRKKSLSDLIKIVSEKMIDPENQTLYIAHGSCPEEVDAFVVKLKQKVKVKDIMIEVMEPTVAAHAGPKMIATFFKGNSRQRG